MRAHSPLISVAALLVALPALAGGTVDFAEVEALLKAKPDDYKQLKAKFIFPASAFAEVRYGDRFKYLAGARLGPYVFTAIQRGKPTTELMEVTICTTVKYLDNKGKALSANQIEGARSIKQTVSAVVVRELSTSPQSPPCPQ